MFLCTFPISPINVIQTYVYRTVFIRTAVLVVHAGVLEIWMVCEKLLADP